MITLYNIEVDCNVYLTIAVGKKDSKFGHVHITFCR